MKSEPTSRGRLYHLRWAMPLAMLVVLVGATMLWYSFASEGQLPVLGRVPAFEMIDQNGNPFGSDDISGKVAIFSFGFTRCGSICPTTQKHISGLYEAYKNSGQVRFVTVSVDEKYDTPEVLKEYADGWKVSDENWVFLSAPRQAVFNLCQTGFMLPAEDIPQSHTARFVLVDRGGRVRGYYDGMDEASAEVLKGHIKLMAQESEGGTI